VTPDGFGWWAGHLLGWALTAVLVMVGAPFWFELLERLITFKSGGSGGQPARADQDPAAATPRVLARDANPAYIASALRVVGAAGSPGSPGTPGEVEVSVPESELLQNIKRAIDRSAPGAVTPAASASGSSASGSSAAS
jgi:hypothetical protein